MELGCLQMLDPTQEHKFYNLTLKNGAVITSSGHVALKLFVANKLVIENGAQLTVRGKGHVGGTITKHGEQAQQGTSPSGNGKESIENNGGGGGGGYLDCGGGGGGYGSTGSNVEQGGKGGELYGDAMLSVLHLGAGGTTQ